MNKLSTSITRLGVGERMSKIVKHNGVVYLSGQICDDESKGIGEQTTSMLNKVEILLNEAGSCKSNILSSTLYIKNMSDFSAMNAVWDNWVTKGAPPARACVQATMARPEILVEVSVVAAVLEEGK